LEVNARQPFISVCLTDTHATLQMNPMAVGTTLEASLDMRLATMIDKNFQHVGTEAELGSQAAVHRLIIITTLFWHLAYSLWCKRWALLLL